MEESNRPNPIKITEAIEKESLDFFFEKSKRLSRIIAETCDLYAAHQLHATGLSAIMFEKLKIALLQEVEIEKDRIAKYKSDMGGK